MDTDELSKETYTGVLIEAERFSHDLTIHFGVMASSCKNEGEYLIKAERLTKEIRKLGKSGLTEMFFGSPPDKEKLDAVLEKILANIAAIKKIPENRRHYDF